MPQTHELPHRAARRCRSDATSCAHCGARLAIVACPHVSAWFLSARNFAPTAARRSRAKKLPPTRTELCPRCRVGYGSGRHWQHSFARMLQVRRHLGRHGLLATNLRRPRTAGRGAGHRHAVVQPATTLRQNIRYLPCPVCDTLMNRVNFAHCSQRDCGRLHGARHLVR